MDGPGQVTSLLHRVGRGDREAETKLLSLIYGELRYLAACYMKRERRDHTLQPTALVHEAYVKLFRGPQPDWHDRKHFYVMAARAMREVLTDHARRRLRSKRGGNCRRCQLEDFALCLKHPVDALALNDSLDRLSAFDPKLESIVELRFFAGMTVEEIADIMTVSPRTIRRDWRLARAWLLGDLTGSDENCDRQMDPHEVAV